MTSLGIFGAGTMGSGLAVAALAAGCRVVLVDVSEDALVAGEQRVAAGLERAAARGPLARSPAELLAALTSSTDATAIADVDVAVEAVPESPELKRTVLARAEAAARPDAVIATNTSSLSIDTLAAALRQPERLVGTHFFNPVWASELVEVVRGSRTAPSAVAAAHALAAELGKVTIEVSDSPGFATSRLGVLLGLEAIRMLEEGVASAEDIDRAMVLGYKHPMGPLRLTDVVGLDVRLAIADYLAGELGSRFQAPRLLRDLVAEGRLGRKSGQGFYAWPPTPQP